MTQITQVRKLNIVWQESASTECSTLQFLEAPPQALKPHSLHWEDDDEQYNSDSWLKVMMLF